MLWNIERALSLNQISHSCADNVWGPEADGGAVEAVRLRGKTCRSSQVGAVNETKRIGFVDFMLVTRLTSEKLMISGGAISNLATTSIIMTKRWGTQISTPDSCISRWRRQEKVEVAAVQLPLLLLLQAQLLCPLLLSDHPDPDQGQILCDQSDDRWSVCVISDPKPRPFAAFRLCYRIHSKAFTRTVYY